MSEDITWGVAVPETGDQIVFDTIGDVFTGYFIGSEIARKDGGTEKDDFTILHFRGRTDGKPYDINAGWKLRKGFENIEPGTLVRVTYVKDVETNAQQPMKDYRIETAR